MEDIALAFDLARNEAAAAGAAAHAPARSSLRALELRAHAAPSEDRTRVESFIRAEYAAHFGARLRGFMPTLLSAYEPDGEIRAAVGVRGAGAGALFLETYTPCPIEQLIEKTLGSPAPRERIVEVGSLACRNGRAAMELVAALVPALIAQGFEWVVFTGADTVRNVFRHLKLQPQALCIANKALLGEAQHDWGSYYEHHPVVMAGRLAEGVEVLEGVPCCR